MNTPTTDAVLMTFWTYLQQAWQNKTISRLILSQYHGEETDLQKILIRPIVLKQQPALTAVWRYKTKDVTKNYLWDDFQGVMRAWLQQFHQVNLLCHDQEIQLKCKKGQWKLSQSKIKINTGNAEIAQTHNREKKRWVDQQQRFLQLLGITDTHQQIIPNMARKWKQINKFVEIFSGAIQQATLNQATDLHVVDFGSGKGYLTCAVYDYIAQQKQQPHVTGVELRPELVTFCQNVATQANYSELKFFQGDVRSYQPEHTDVMIALHACDIATDFAIHTGIRLGAKVIMCAPCCHKELRPQLTSPEVLQPMLQFGVHAGQEAEMLTDSLRAMLLQAYGYEVKVLEFISLEHTGKNKMILAIKHRDTHEVDQSMLDKVDALKAFYGIQQQTLEHLLKDLPVDNQVGCAC